MQGFFMKKRFLLIALTTLFCQSLRAEDLLVNTRDAFISPSIEKTSKTTHKIIYMISTARSLSTVFARYMAGRGDFRVYNEPAFPPFLQKNAETYPMFVPYFKEGTLQTTHAEVQENLLHQAILQNIFIKEMPFLAQSFLQDNLTFIQNPQVQFVFLIRNPHDVLISFNKCWPLSQKEANIQEPALDYELLYNLYAMITKHTTKKPYIIISENICSETSTTIQNFCTATNIPFDPSQLSWNDAGDNFNVSIWEEAKKADPVKHWHENALRSTGFQQVKSSKRKLDEYKIPTFEEIENSEGRSLALTLYTKNFPFYKKFLEEAMTIKA